MAFTYARELDTSPEEALLLAVRISAARNAWLDQHVADALTRWDKVRELQVATGVFDPEDGSNKYALPTGISGLLAESRRERLLLARVARAALASGAEERLVGSHELIGRMVVSALATALAESGLTEDAQRAAQERARRYLAERVAVA